MTVRDTHKNALEEFKAAEGSLICRLGRQMDARHGGQGELLDPFRRRAIFNSAEDINDLLHDSVLEQHRNQRRIQQLGEALRTCEGHHQTLQYRGVQLVLQCTAVLARDEQRKLRRLLRGLQEGTSKPKAKHR